MSAGAYLSWPIEEYLHDANVFHTKHIVTAVCL